jgi:hypothetical protein
VERGQEVDTIQWRYPPVYGAGETFFTGDQPESPDETSGTGGLSPLPELRIAPPEGDEPPVRSRPNRCQRWQKKQTRQKKGVRRARLQCNRVRAGKGARR